MSVYIIFNFILEMCIFLYLYHQDVNYYIYFLQHYSLNYKDFLSNNSNINDDNKKLKDELDKYKKENEEMKNKINELSNENIELKNDLIRANTIISNFNNNIQQNNTVNLNEIIKNKDIEISNLKLQLQLQNKNNINVNFNDIINVNIISSDQKINYSIKCLKTDIFAEVEEKFYQKYEEYRETNNNFIAKGRLILRFKKIFENYIQDGEKIQLLKPE